MWTRRLGDHVQAGAPEFPPKRPDRLWGPTSPLFSVYRDSFPVVKRPGCDLGHSPKSNAEFKNEWSYTSAVRPSISTKLGTIHLFRCFVTWFEGIVWKIQVGVKYLHILI
jgi:hypothetical protein